MKIVSFTIQGDCGPRANPHDYTHRVNVAAESVEEAKGKISEHTRECIVAIVVYHSGVTGTNLDLGELIYDAPWHTRLALAARVKAQLLAARGLQP